MSTALKELLSVYQRATFRVFTGPGLIFTLILLVLFSLMNLIDFKFNILGRDVQLLIFNPLTLIIAIFSSVITMSLWWFLGTKYAPKIGEFLTENKIGNLVFTKGDIHYFEKVDLEELRIAPGKIIAKFINILIAYLSVTAFLLGFWISLVSIIMTDQTGTNILITFFEANNLILGVDLNLDYIAKILIVFLFAPLLLTIVIPIPWMLIDTKLKSYNSNLKVNYLVGRSVQRRLTPIFAIGGLVTLLLNNISIDFVILFFTFIFIFLAFPSLLIVTLYNMLFQVQYYESFLRSIPVPFGTTKIDLEVKFRDESMELSDESKNQENIDEIDNNGQDNNKN